MRLPFHIARRYLFAKKSTNAVNWITGISSLGVMVGTAAMVVVLSAFAGLDTLVRSVYVSFDPDIKVIPATGKFAPWTPAEQDLLLSMEGLKHYSKVVEDKALFRHHEREYIATVKGVDTRYSAITDIDSSLTRGHFLSFNKEKHGAVLGYGVSVYLGVSNLASPAPIHVYVPRAGKVDQFNPMGNVRFKLLYPEGIFQVQPEFDAKYVITSIDFAQQLFNVDTLISGMEIALEPGTDLADFKQELGEKLGQDWVVLDRDDLQVAIFKVLKSEGLITYLVLTFILLVASFGILSSVNILILEKKKDLITLWSMGASEKLLRRIFMAEGLLISVGGALIGFVLGVVIVVLQQQIGLVSIGAGYIVEYYPVEFRAGDILQVILTILVVGFSISWLAVRRLKIEKLKLS